MPEEMHGGYPVPFRIPAIHVCREGTPIERINPSDSYNGLHLY